MPVVAMASGGTCCGPQQQRTANAQSTEHRPCQPHQAVAYAAKDAGQQRPVARVHWGLLLSEQLEPSSVHNNVPKGQTAAVRERGAETALPRADERGGAQMP
jgi:hypothetical protein